MPDPEVLTASLGLGFGTGVAIYTLVFAAVAVFKVIKSA